jgi:dTDP-4-amino-4,6-dideoxygalactose transaminase
MLRFQRPAMPSAAAIEHYFARSRDARWFSNGGPCWELLRDRLSERVGAYCVPVANGTLGLMAAVAAVQREGDVLVPSFTFPATPQSATWAGLRPRLLDIDATHWHLDPEQLEQEVHTAALAIAVSAFGTPPPAAVRERWEQACRAAGVPLIVDSAAAFGATPIGTQGDVEVVSFHATKPFAIGEGGAVFTRDAKLRDRIELAINFGLDRTRTVRLPHATNGKLSELHAATALAVLDTFDDVLAARRAAARQIRAAAPELSWQAECERSTWQFVPVAFPDTASRDAVARATRDTLETRVYYEPLHTFEALRDWPTANLERTEDLAGRILCLPMANDLTAAEVGLIASALTRGHADHGRVRRHVGDHHGAGADNGALAHPHVGDHHRT